MRSGIACILSWLVFTTMSAQMSTVDLSFNHRLNGQPFSPGMVAPKDNYFYKITSLRYYVSGIELVFTDGEVLKLTDVVGLEDPFKSGNHYRVEHNNTSEVDSVRFYIGVDELRNHADPTLYAFNHPLAPQDPTMHWGWQAGYRFVALEGYAGSTPAMLHTNFQIHALGDELYTLVSVGVQDSIWNGTHVVRIDAEYGNALNGINASLGVINHSSEGEAITLMNNYRSVVFTNGMFTSVEDVGQSDAALHAFPNPSHDALILESSLPDHTLVVLSDTYGREATRGMIVNGRVSIDVSSLSAGTYTAVAAANHRIESVRVAVAP